MILLGLAGYARTGKDTVADYLVERHGFTKLAFAQPLKRMLLTLNPLLDGGVPLHEAILSLNGNEDELKVSYPEYRRLMATLGTDCIRAQDEDFWIKAMVDEVQRLPRHSRIVISDVRFPNEAEFIKTGVCPDYFMVAQKEFFDGQVWRIQRPGYQKGKCMHPSEASVDLIRPNRTILNNGFIGDLQDVVDKALDTFIGVSYEAAA